MLLSQTVPMAVAMFAFVTQVEGFWRMPCRARSGLARIDPLVSNGTLSEHAHAIHGSSGFSPTAGYHDLMAGDCTSCEVTQDKSAYWTPALYFLSDSTKKYTLVNQVGGMLAYYLLFPNSNNKTLSGFPAGFEMIAGDTNQRNFSYPVPDIQKSNWNVAPYNSQTFLRQAALGFNCLNYAKTPEGSLYRHGLPTKAFMDENCSDGIRFELMFPSCWNGKDVTSRDKKSHVAYPSQVMTGECDAEFPIRLPSLFYETIWDTHAFAGQQGSFMLANGDPTGFGYHGDFMMGWDPKFLQEAVNTCTNPSGKIEDCPLFTLQDSSAYSNCNIKVPPTAARENLIGGMASLPGNAPIFAGPGYGSGAAAGENSASFIASAAPLPSTTQSAMSLSYSAGSSVTSSQSFVPGAIFAASSGATFSPSSSPSAVAPKVSVLAAVEAISTPTPSYFSTSYTTISPSQVEEVLWVEEVVTITAPGPTVTFSVPGRKRHVHGHARRF